MHELALAEAIVAVAARHAGDRTVTAVEVRVGALRQVVPSALEFGFQLVAEGTPLAGARLELEEVPAAVRCRRCEQESEARDFPLACAACRGLDVEVIGGEELTVVSVEVDEPVVVSGGRDG